MLGGTSKSSSSPSSKSVFGVSDDDDGGGGGGLNTGGGGNLGGGDKDAFMRGEDSRFFTIVMLINSDGTPTLLLLLRYLRPNASLLKLFFRMELGDGLPVGVEGIGA